MLAMHSLWLLLQRCPGEQCLGLRWEIKQGGEDRVEVLCMFWAFCLRTAQKLSDKRTMNLFLKPASKGL